MYVYRMTSNVSEYSPNNDISTIGIKGGNTYGVQSILKTPMITTRHKEGDMVETDEIRSLKKDVSSKITPLIIGFIALLGGAALAFSGLGLVAAVVGGILCVG